MIGYSSVQQDRATLGFTVVQNNGGSTTSWTGQCQFCDGQEVLRTTWIRSKEVNHCWEMKYANRSVYQFYQKRKPIMYCFHENEQISHHKAFCFWGTKPVVFPGPSRLGDSPTRRSRAKMRKKMSKVWGKIRKNLSHFEEKWGKWNSCQPGTVRLATALHKTEKKESLAYVPPIKASYFLEREADHSKALTHTIKWAALRLKRLHLSVVVSFKGYCTTNQKLSCMCSISKLLTPLRKMIYAS